MVSADKSESEKVDEKLNFSEKSCGVVIYRRQKNDKGDILFLILHYAGGHWGFPKGHVEKGETEHGTALRELEEETGIKTVEFVDTFRHEMYYEVNGRFEDKKVLKQVIFFLGETSEEKVIVSHEHQGYKWLKFDEALEQITYENSKEVLKDVGGFL